MLEEHRPEKHLNSIRFALSGLAHAFSTQRNFRIQLIFGAITLLLAALINFNRVEWIVLLLTIGLVLTAELANTILETLVDLAIQEYHPKARIAKDLAAAAVLIIALFSFLIGLMLFVPNLIEFFS